VVSTSTFASADDAELRMTCEAFAPGSSGEPDSLLR
jgi:hypothetical protein